MLSIDRINAEILLERAQEYVEHPCQRVAMDPRTVEIRVKTPMEIEIRCRLQEKPCKLLIMPDLFDDDVGSCEQRRVAYAVAKSFCEWCKSMCPHIPR